jgi:hypothetical protein
MKQCRSSRSIVSSTHSTGRLPWAFHNFLDLGDLLGQMHVQRIGTCQHRMMMKILGQDGAQAVRGNADPAIGRKPKSPPCRFRMQAPHRREIIAEPDLAGSKRAPVAAAILIVHRQQVSPMPVRHWRLRSVRPFRRCWHRELPSGWWCR